MTEREAAMGRTVVWFSCGAASAVAAKLSHKPNTPGLFATDKPIQGELFV